MKECDNCGEVVETTTPVVDGDYCDDCAGDVIDAIEYAESPDDYYGVSRWG